jgi:hypothetical protein
VFELLGLSTFDYLRENDFLPFTVEHIRHMAFQIFRAVCCESGHLHPNNVPLVVPSSALYDHGTCGWMS